MQALTMAEFERANQAAAGVVLSRGGHHQHRVGRVVQHPFIMYQEEGNAMGVMETEVQLARSRML